MMYNVSVGILLLLVQTRTPADSCSFSHVFPKRTLDTLLSEVLINFTLQSIRSHPFGRFMNLSAFITSEVSPGPLKTEMQ